MTCDASQGIYVPLRIASTALLALMKILSALFGSVVSDEPPQTVPVHSSGRSPHPTKPPSKSVEAESKPDQAADEPGQTEPLQASEVHAASLVEKHAGRFASPLRLAAFIVALTPLTLLGVARCLQPSPQGLGTHHQLGLPPCSMRVLLGIRCPGCGMTTSWAHFTRGQWGQSIRVNPGGFLLALFSLATAVLAIRTVWSGRLPIHQVQAYYTYCLVGIAVITLLDWCARLMG